MVDHKLFRKMPGYYYKGLGNNKSIKGFRTISSALSKQYYNYKTCFLTFSGEGEHDWGAAGHRVNLQQGSSLKARIWVGIGGS